MIVKEFSDVPDHAFDLSRTEYIDELRLKAEQKMRLHGYALTRMGFSSGAEYYESDASTTDSLNTVMSYFLSVAVKFFLDSEYGL